MKIATKAFLLFSFYLALILPSGSGSESFSGSESESGSSSLSSVDLQPATVTVSVVGDPLSVDWQIAPDLKTVRQELNGEPTAFCTPVQVTPNLAVEASIVAETHTDNDYFGIIVGFQNAIKLLLDWKKIDQYKNNPPCDLALAKRGLALSQIMGAPNRDELWAHQNMACTGPSHGVQELQRGFNLGDRAWEQFKDYHFRFEFGETTVKIFVDGVLEFDTTLPAGFNYGKFCFYNFSQRKVRYGDFAVEDISPTAVPTDTPTDVPTSIPTNVPTEAPMTKEVPMTVHLSGKMSSDKMSTSTAKKTAPMATKKKPAPMTKPTSMGKKKRRAL